MFALPVSKIIPKTLSSEPNPSGPTY